MLELVGLDPSIYGPRYPHQLSGGQRQRVGVARALAADPPVVLMDEPFGAVDPIARGRLQEQFLDLQRQLGTTVVLVTHDIDEAVLLGDRLAVMREGGYLDQYAEPGTVLGSPATPFVADFVGSDRTIKRLALTPIDLTTLAPAQDIPGQPTMDAAARMREALVVLLDSPTGTVLVTRDGQPLGTLTMDAVHRAMAPRSRRRERGQPVAELGLRRGPLARAARGRTGAPGDHPGRDRPGLCAGRPTGAAGAPDPAPVRSDRGDLGGPVHDPVAGPDLRAVAGVRPSPSPW